MKANSEIFPLTNPSECPEKGPKARSVDGGLSKSESHGRFALVPASIWGMSVDVIDHAPLHLPHQLLETRPGGVVLHHVQPMRDDPRCQRIEPHERGRCSMGCSLKGCGLGFEYAE